ncbi:MAG: ribosome biogenesis GTPase Der [Armatimonadetes bacterium]|nr:ribosome biogenesis GTPase Der [Armatimonadota bacterium]
MPRPIVAIVGRPNVGKSTLFNRLLGRRVAIVEDTPGVTRDRVYGHTDWRGREFTVVDTGGLGLTEAPYTAIVAEQAQAAIEEADLILFLVDGKEGPTPLDQDLADQFRTAQRPVLLVVNKVDNTPREAAAQEFYALGLGEIYPISALNGRDVADLLDEVVERLLPAEPEPEEEERIKLAIVGRPNVGKSSLLNAILGYTRTLVSPVAGTTRDPVDVPFEHGPHRYLLIDTAGIRRPGKYQGSLEYYCVLRAERALQRADVGVVVVDASFGVVDGDKRVAGLTHELGRGCVIFVNKWDLVKGRTPREFGKTVRDEMPFLSYAPIVVGSSLQRRGMDELLETCADVANNHALRVNTSELNRVLHEAVDARPYTRRGRQFKIYYATMPSVKPPCIVLFVNDPRLPHISYMRYLENQLRAKFGFMGTPLNLVLRPRTREEAEERMART